MTIIHDYPVIIPFVAILSAEVVKFTLDFFTNRSKLRFINSGGMPSGHSSFVSSAVVVVAYYEGLGSISFMLTSALALIVMYDAINLRNETGKHAKALNKIDPTLKLEESLGHNHFEVVVGAIFGALIAFLLLMI